MALLSLGCALPSFSKGSSYHHLLSIDLNSSEMTP